MLLHAVASCVHVSVFSENACKKNFVSTDGSINFLQVGL